MNPVSHLLREDGQAMNPKAILSGYYGARGEKLKYTVHEGALRLPAAALELMNPINLEGKYALPSVDAILRPSQTDGDLLVTQLTLQVDPETGNPMTLAHNRCFVLGTEEQRIRGGGDGDDEGDHIKMESMEIDPISTEQSVDPVAPVAEDEATTATPSATTSASTDGVKIEPLLEATTATPSATTSASTDGVKIEPLLTETTVTAIEPSNVETSAGAESAEADSPAPVVDASEVLVPVTAAPIPPPVKDPVAAAVPSTTVIVSAPSTTATTSSSSATTTTAAPAEADVKIVPLVQKPASQWEQNFIPGPNDEMQVEIKTPPPYWYSPTSISDLERSMLPEWFDGSATHRTPETYLKTRERIRTMSQTVGNRYITQTLVRRTIAGDAGSLHRLHAFLVTWSLINEDAINDSNPTAAGLREELVKKRPFVWSDRLRDDLTEAVVEESNNKRQKTMDWNAVAKRVGNGAQAQDCQVEFLALPLESRATAHREERSITPDVMSDSDVMARKDPSRDDTMTALIESLVSSVKPSVVAAAAAAALEASSSEDLLGAQQGAVVALMVTKAAERAREEEVGLRRALEELHEQRLQKLENRSALMDDIECILEAERVALELERRDLYTARCRHWFGGGN